MTFTIESPSGATLAHVSEKPWSDYTKADYSIEQWHNACLIHQHQGAPTSKNQCKLPVRTPNGALNRNGVHAAAAALSGARGGVSATDSELASARTALARLYSQLNEQAPPSLVKHSDMDQDERLVHFGVKGMHWGVRKSEDSGGSSSGGSSGKQKMSTKKKVAIGTGIAAGAAAAALLLSKRGRSTVSSVAQKMFEDRSNARSMQKADRAMQKNYFSDLKANNPFTYHTTNAAGRVVNDQAAREATLARVMKTHISEINSSMDSTTQNLLRGTNSRLMRGAGG
jgi:hypothetical protein